MPNTTILNLFNTSRDQHLNNLTLGYCLSDEECMKIHFWQTCVMLYSLNNGT